ncbi:MAG: HEPN domain-containing protein [Crocinitomicaceae bacterium]
MKDLQEFRGEWFSPKQEGVKLPGILTINRKENDFKLTLFSEKDIAGEIILERDCNIINYCKIILGRTSKGDVTLYNHSGDEGGAPMLEHAITKNLYEIVYRPNFVFIGKHFHKPEHITFNSYSFRYNFLDSWIDTTQSFYDTKHTSQSNTIITIPSIPETKIQIGENCSASITRDLYSKGGFLSRNYDLEIKHYVNFNFDKPTPLQEYLNLSGKLSAFLTFAVGYPISTIDEFASTDNTDKWHEGRPLEVHHTYLNHDVDNRRLFVHGMFFCSQNTRREYLVNYLSEWFNIYDIYHDAIDLFLDAISTSWEKGSSTVTKVQFTNGILNICQAIETFYQADNGIDYTKTKKELNTLKQKGFDKILKCKEEIKFTDEELEYYKNHFKVPRYKSEVDYKHQISYYLNALKDALNGFIDEDEFEDFAKTLKDCRNALTHVNEYRDVDENFDLPYLFFHSQILFYSIVTNSIGMEHGKINNVMKTSDKFRRYHKN